MNPNPYAEHACRTELTSLLIQFGVEEVDRLWKALLINLEAQIKVALKREETAASPAQPIPQPLPPQAPQIPPTPEAPKLESDDKKTIHKNAILKKREDLAKQNVEGRTLLTEANLKKWIAEGKTYWKIAEETGVWDAEVSALAKNFGIQSAVSKIIAFKKK